VAIIAEKKSRLGWKVALLYFFMNVFSVSLFSYVIVMNQGELISENTRFQAKDLVANLVDKLRRMPAMPSSAEGYTDSDRKDIAQKISKAISTFTPAHVIFNNAGILASSDNGITLPANSANQANKARTLREQAGADFFLQLDSENKILRFYIPLDEFALSGCTALLEMDLHSVGQRFNDLYRQIGFMVIAISLLHIIFAYVIYRLILNPIVSLTKATRIVSEGNYNHVVPSDRNDELGELATGFNHMTSVIRDQIDRLKTSMEDLETAHRKVKEMAITDELTGLYNRHHLHSALETTLQTTDRYNRPMGLLLLDVDHFKRVNDTYGHSIGDVVLKNIAQILQRTVRTSDLVARYGGEEMVVVLPETDAKGSIILAEKIRVIIANTPIATGSQQPLRVSVSIGVSEFQSLKEENGKAPEIRDLVNAADEALYRAKENGRNRVVVHEISVQE